MKRESAIFWAASGVIALHVIDDNFVQPQPGTSAFDHLVSGLLAPAALVALAAIYGRRKPGVRASIAFTLGLLAIAAAWAKPGTTPSGSGRPATTTPDSC